MKSVDPYSVNASHIDNIYGALSEPGGNDGESLRGSCMALIIAYAPIPGFCKASPPH